MKITKERAMPAIVLGAICLAVALVIGLVNLVAAPIIERAKKEAISESLRVVMPDGSFDESLPLDGMPETVTGVYKDENRGGHVVTLSTTKGYTGKPINLTVGVDLNGKITGAIITATEETKDTDKVAAFAEGFKGADAAGVAGSALVSGATYSSTAVKNAIGDAMIALGYAKATDGEDAPADNGGVSTLSKEELYARALAMVDGATSLIRVQAEGLPTTARAVFHDEGSGAYVLYLVTRTGWVPTETEGLVLVNKHGTIEKVEMITWTVGHGVNYTPDYIQSFVGKNKNTVSHVELVAEATRTADNFATAVDDTLEILFPNNDYRFVGLTAIAVCVILTAVYLVFKKRRGF